MDSAFLCKTRVTAAAGDRGDALAAGQTQPGFAAGTLEILVGLAVLEAYLGLTAFGALFLSHGHIAAVFSTALVHIAREDAEDAEAVCSKTGKI